MMFLQNLSILKKHHIKSIIVWICTQPGLNVTFADGYTRTLQKTHESPWSSIWSNRNDAYTRRTNHFLEINPAGHWMFIEEHTKQPITESFSKLLCRYDK